MASQPATSGLLRYADHFTVRSRSEKEWILRRFKPGVSHQLHTKAQARWQKADHFLRDLLFDDAGHRMTATHATKAGVRYRYYVSQPGLHGEARMATLGSVCRVAASEIEHAIVSALREQITGQNAEASDRDDPIQLDHDALTSLVSCIEVQRTQLDISLRPADRSIEAATLSIPWQKRPSKRFRKMLMPHGALREDIRLDRAERRLRLISAIARGRRWLDEIIAGSITDAGQLAKRERCTVRQINMTLSLAFLAPALVKAAVEGRLPRGINIERLRHPDPIWAKQFHNLGLSPN